VQIKAVNIIYGYLITMEDGTQYRRDDAQIWFLLITPNNRIAVMSPLRTELEALFQIYLRDHPHE
jgi:hypothetical protein